MKYEVQARKQIYTRNNTMTTHHALDATRRMGESMMCGDRRFSTVYNATILYVKMIIARALFPSSMCVHVWIGGVSLFCQRTHLVLHAASIFIVAHRALVYV